MPTYLSIPIFNKGTSIYDVKSPIGLSRGLDYIALHECAFIPITENPANMRLV